MAGNPGPSTLRPPVAPAAVAGRTADARRARRTAQIAAQVVAATSDAVMAIDHAGEIIFWNAAAERMFGIGAGEAIGRTLDLILPPALAARHKQGFARAIGGAPPTLTGTTVELSACRADGSEFPIELSLSRWGGVEHDSGFAAIIRDITGRKTLERERRHAQDFLDSVVANLPASLSVKDSESREYVFVNRTWEELIGKSAQDAIGHTDRVLFPVQGEAFEHRDDAALAGTAEIEFESAFTRGDGTVVQIRTRRIVIDGLERPKQYIVRLGEDVTEIRRAEAAVRHLAHFDALTGLINRRHGMERMDRLVAAGAPFALVRIDLDRFKAVNDQFGPLVGDAVLAQVGERLRAIAGPADVISRIAGDEFVMMLLNNQPASRAQTVAKAVVKSLGEPFVLADVTAHIAASIGIVLAPEDGTDAEVLRQGSRLAMRRAKQQGRGSICCFSAEMDAAERDRQSIEGELRAALDAGDITLAYQPVLSVATGQVTSVEALARWTHPVRGPISPEIFIPLAEESGLICELGEHILRQACADATAWPDHLRVAVNLSPLQFQHDDLCATVLDVLRDSGLAANRLQLEVTEGLLIRDIDRTFATLEHLRALGIQILMDDFGVGYSSLSYFERFSFDKVKIDKSFVTGLATSRAAKAIIKAVIGLGQQLDMGIVAEGVETEEQLQVLVALGCTHLQGYLFSRPVAAAAITAMTATARTHPPVAPLATVAAITAP